MQIKKYTNMQNKNRKTKTLSIKVTEDQYKNVIYALKEEYGVNISAYIRKNLEKYLEALKTLDK